jgi:transposase
MTKTPIAVLGIDLGKNSCSLAGLDATGAVIMRRRMTREGRSSSLPRCRRAWLRWKHAVERTS